MSAKIDNNRRVYKNVLGYTETYAPSANTYRSILPLKQRKDGTTGVDTSGAGAATSGTVAPTTYSQILQGLEQQRQSAMQSAEAQYARSQASYGQMGDQLNRQGLNNSGYAAALDSAAYASRARSMDAANAVYSQGVANADYQRQAKYEDVLGKLYSGEVGADYAKKYGESYGFTTEQMKGVEDEVRTQITSQMKADPSSYTLAYFDELAANGTISPEEAARYQADQNLSVYNQFDRIVKSGNIKNIDDASADLDNLYKNGNIDEPTYNNAKRLLSSSYALTAKFNAGSITAREYVEGMVSDGKASFALPYAIPDHTGASDIRDNGALLIHDDVDLKLPTGENFDLRTVSQRPAPSEIQEKIGELNSNPKHNDFVLYEGKLYAFSGRRNENGGWYELEGDVDDINKAIAAILKYQQSKS